MPKYTLIARVYIVLAVLLGLSHQVQASHIIGGNMTYRYLGLSGTKERYEVTFTLYDDCINGQPDAISNDNPAFFAVYGKVNHTLVAKDTTATYISSVVLAPAALNPCKFIGANVCIMERQFKSTFLLPASTDGYIVSYQRCCFASTPVNIPIPGDIGPTYYCVIPPAIKNTSAVFKYNSQFVTCVNDNLAMDLSASDADGDSLSYELVNILKGGDPNNIKPFPKSGPYDSIVYRSPATTLNPMGIAGGMALDPSTGVLSCKPDRIGTYFLAVNCIEWRGGVAINKVYQHFQVIVSSCADAYTDARKDTVVLKGTTIQFHAYGGAKYQWFTGYNLSNDTIPDPTAVFNEIGTFKYAVVVTAVIGCEVTDSIIVHVVDHSDATMPNAFTPNGDGLNDIFKPEFMGPCNVKYLRIYNRYGNLVYDGTDGWDGRYKGMMQDMEVFAWTLLYENNLGEPKLLKGNVTLIK